MATVTNKQDTAIHFWVMTCSWPSENWVSSNDSVFCAYPGCDSNFPIQIDLLPHQSLNFYGILAHTVKTSFPKIVKLGFRYFTRGDALFETSAQTRNAAAALFWSNEVELRDNLFKFQMEPVGPGI
jgi:hypothetical protein